MDVNDWINKVGYRKVLTTGDPDNCSFGDDRHDYEVWLSKYDDSYITLVGMEEDIRFLADRDICEQLSHGVGFSQKNNKWYGWSHRAICGFTIGSTCKKGDCHYKAANIEDELEAAISFWSSEDHKRTTARILDDGKIVVEWEYSDKVKNKKIRNTLCSVELDYDPEFGRGEWTAETLEDAKQMAIDFNKGVS